MLDVYSEWLQAYPIASMMEPFGAPDAHLGSQLVAKGNAALAARHALLLASLPAQHAAVATDPAASDASAAADTTEQVSVMMQVYSQSLHCILGGGISV